ncbi:MAG TPA: DNA lyase [Candidatus Kapabacteria bacterium]|nr:DNA lyase [Candidatus Kapabacteria bacterium]
MNNSPLLELPEPWKSIYAERAEAIKLRLDDFASVHESEHFYELLFCILTPQSSARNAGQVIAKLKDNRFYEVGDDPTEILRNPAHYIRFHNTKAKRLLVIRENFSSIRTIIQAQQSDLPQLREEIRIAVPGFGLKESSHFLRNIGFRGYGILDRHIFKHLLKLKVIGRMPKSLTEKRYYSIEKKWKKYADTVGISIDELDLLFWSMETGEILK